MAASAPAATVSNVPHKKVKEQVTHEFTFPPFPKPPPGVVITPFKDFREHGIQIFVGDDDVEVDGLGIPTVSLRVKHETDECKTNKRKRKTASAKKAQEEEDRAAGIGPRKVYAKKEWWELWEQGEDLRSTSVYYNPNASQTDRFHQAATDFKTSRTWPPTTTGLRENWEQFRLFVGLLTDTPIWRRVDKEEPKEEGDAEADVEDEVEMDSDDEFFGSESGTQPPSKVASQVDLTVDDASNAQKPIQHQRPRTPYAMYGKEGGPKLSTDEEVTALIKSEREKKEERMDSFFEDPEKMTKVWLSSYMRDQGYIWYDRNLTNIPRLTGFFYNFLLRNNVLPDEKGLRAALKVVDLALIELPLTTKISKVLPDKFGEACKNCWGPKDDPYVGSTPAQGDTSSAKETDQQDGAALSEEEPVAKKAKTDTEDATDIDMPLADEVVVTDQEVIAAEVEEILSPDTLEATLAPAEDYGTWGSLSAPVAWGAEPTKTEAEPAAGLGDYDADLNAWAGEQGIDWSPVVQRTLLAYLGPTALPLTHTTGIVERSLRRIKAVHLPSPAPAQKKRVRSEADPLAVESELEHRLARVVLEPWLNWDEGTAESKRSTSEKPRILVSSRGAIIDGGEAVNIDDEDANGVTVVPAAPESDLPEGQLKPHDPLKDDIVLLVDPEAAPALRVGLGVGATWVQIVREADLGDGAKVVEPGKKMAKGKGKGKEGPEARFWYLDKLMMIFPSYYTAA